MPENMGGMVPDPNHPAWKIVQEMYVRGDLARLERMLRREEGYEALTRMGKLAQQVLLWLGSMFAIYWAGQAAVEAWVRKVAE